MFGYLVVARCCVEIYLVGVIRCICNRVVYVVIAIVISTQVNVNLKVLFFFTTYAFVHHSMRSHVYIQ